MSDREFVSRIRYNLMNCQISSFFGFFCFFYSFGFGKMSLCVIFSCCLFFFIVSESQHWYYFYLFCSQPRVLLLTSIPTRSTHPLWRANNQFQVDCAPHALTHPHKSATHLVSDSLPLLVNHLFPFARLFLN